MNIDFADLQIVLVFLGSWAAVSLCKILLRSVWLPEDGPKVNAIISAAIGVGVALLQQGEPIERVVLGAAAAVISGAGASAVHAVGHKVAGEIPGRIVNKPGKQVL